LENLSYTVDPVTLLDSFAFLFYFFRRASNLNFFFLVRLNSVTGWCGQQEAFTYVSVDLGTLHRVKAILVKVRIIPLSSSVPDPGSGAFST
jgi:hypothetical protein